MNTVTIPKKEYEVLRKAKEKLDMFFGFPYMVEKKKPKFTGKSFGILRKNFGKKSSVSYISKMRESWRA